MLHKSLKIIQKVLVIIWNNRKNKPFDILILSYQRYRISGRKELTKGINNTYKALIRKDKNLTYKKWIEKNEEQNHLIDNKLIKHAPLISIIMPVYNTKIKWLREAIDSVLSQNYKNWELCIADDASTNQNTLMVLKEYSQKYRNIKVIYRADNGHISEASNSALALANGEYIAFLDHDDTLALNALYEVVKVINVDRNIKLIYSDEDKIDERGKRFDPHFKSDWNPDMFYAQNYISHLSIIKKEIIDKTEKFRVGYEGSQDYDLILQCLKFLNNNEIYHISKVLYHWRAIEGSTALDVNQKNYTTDAGIKALQYHFKDNAQIGISEGFLPNTYKVNYEIKNNPLVTIIIPTKNQQLLLKKCITSILEKSDYTNYEIIIVDNQTTEAEALAYLNSLKTIKNIKVLNYDKPFNYAAINNYAVGQAKGEFILLLNNDIEVINSAWLGEMLQHVEREEIGIVGAKLYYEDMTLQHAGVVLGIGGVAGHAHKYFAEDAYGYFSRLQIIQNYSALTGACMLIKKSLYLEVEGLDENLKVAFNDIDLSLKVLQKGYRNLWTPYAKLIHYESKSRGFEDTPEKKERFDKEIAFMKEKWGKELLRDRCYNPNLTLEHENFSLKIEEKN